MQVSTYTEATSEPPGQPWAESNLEGFAFDGLLDGLLVGQRVGEADGNEILVIEARNEPTLLGGTTRAKPATVDVLGTHGAHVVGTARADHAPRLVMYFAGHLYPPALFPKQRVDSVLP